MNRGTLCISLDFEKFWGVHDVSDINEVEQKMLKVSDIVSRLLKLFDKYEIHCTWAIVGLLNFKSVEELLSINNSVCYINQKLSPFPLSKFNLSKFNSNSFLGFDDILNIKKAKYQELASHTFSHFYCLEIGAKSIDFMTDINLFKTHISNDIKSIVFPRNQIDSDCLKICKQNGIIAYRGNQPNRYWKNTAFSNEKITQKIGRTIDAYVKITKDNFIDWKELTYNNQGLINIFASRFFKPVQFPNFIEKLKVNRIKKQMLLSAKQNKIYHLWWHPHNFTTNTDQNFKQLEEILIYFTQLKKTYNYQSLNMNEIVNEIG
jgi:hypothetical protein